MTRIIFGVLAGIAAAVAVVAAGEAIGHSMFPPPPGTDLSDPAALKTLIDNVPTGAIAAVLIAWAAGAFIGGGVAAYVARREWAAWIIGGLMLAGGVATMMAIPHPIWFAIASIPAALAPAWLAGRCFAGSAQA